MYDYLIVGAGLFGATIANLAHKDGKSVLVLDKRNHIAGNIYTKEVDGIQIHKYGAHIFHTDNEKVWKYINKFGKFNNYINSPIARYKNELYNLPFNMNTFCRIWDGCYTPDKAIKNIEKERKEIQGEPTNLEEQAISLVGRTIYEKLIKGYTEKQWGKSCKELSPDIIKRLPVRLTYNNNYFNDKYQGIPIEGYTKLIENMLEGIDVKLCCDYLEYKDDYRNMAKMIIYTGPIDEYYDYCFGKLEYRSLRFKEKKIRMNNFQGNAVVNYTDRRTPYTRIIEHKHFNNIDSNNTIITYEYPAKWNKGKEPYYPMNNEKNNELYKQYEELANTEKKIVFGGRLGMYKYLDMDDTIEEAMKLYKKIK